MKSIVSYFTDSSKTSCAASSSQGSMQSGSTQIVMLSSEAEIETAEWTDGSDVTKKRKQDAVAGVHDHQNGVEAHFVAPATPAQLELNSDNQSSEQKDSGTEIAKCLGPCCNEETILYQTREEALLAQTVIIYGSGRNKRERSFQASWYESYKWLVLCTSRLKAFCFYCRFLTSRGLNTFSSKADGAFSIEGFSNWKKALEKFADHERCQAHKEACIKFNAIMKQKSVDEQLKLVAQKEQIERRQMFLTLLSSLRYLLRQGLAVRGHGDDSEGNLSQLLKARAEDSIALQKWIKTGSYQSPEVLNELTNTIGAEVLREVLNGIKSSRWFSIIGDETRDISNSEQLSISIRWVDKDYSIHEDFIGMFKVPKTDAEMLSLAIEDVLVRCVLPISQCRGQAYDGASNMAGPKSGVAARILQRQPTAIPVHCLCHCINLCLQDVSRKCKCIRDALDLVYELVGLIKYSPKREHLFTQYQLQDSPNIHRLKPLCPTRWTCRTGSINAVIENYAVLQQTLEEIAETCRDEYGRKAAGFQALMGKFSTFFGLKLAHVVFGASEQLSTTLQSKDTTAQDARLAVNLCKAFYDRQRDASAFQIFYQAVLLEANGKTEPPTLPRYSNPPKRINDGDANFRFATAEHYHRREYFEIMESLSGELDARFDQKGFHLAALVEATILDNCSGKSYPIPKEVQDLYSKDLNIDRLQTQLSMLPDLVKSYVLEGKQITKVTTIRTLCDVLNAFPIVKDMLSEVHSLLILYMTIPVTSSTAERTFSALRRLKSYMRSTMTQERLNNVMVAHIYKEITDRISLINIAQRFCSANDRRKVYFGHFE